MICYVQNPNTLLCSNVRSRIRILTIPVVKPAAVHKEIDFCYLYLKSIRARASPYQQSASQLHPSSQSWGYCHNRFRIFMSVHDSFSILVSPCCGHTSAYIVSDCWLHRDLSGSGNILMSPETTFKSLPASFKWTVFRDALRKNMVYFAFQHIRNIFGLHKKSTK